MGFNAGRVDVWRGDGEEYVEQQLNNRRREFINAGIRDFQAIDDRIAAWMRALWPDPFDHANTTDAFIDQILKPGR